MKNILVLTEPSMNILSWNFKDKESARYALCGVSESNDERRYFVREVITATDEDYKFRNFASACTKGSFVYEIYNKAYNVGLPCVIFAHTHPQEAFFSTKDDSDGETHLKNMGDFNIRYYIRIVVGEDGLTAVVHNHDGKEPIDYILVYKSNGIDVITPKNSQFKPDFPVDTELHDRTIQIGGNIHEALKLMGFLKVGVIGVGGIGSAFLNIFKHLGLQKVVLVDPDILERSNANRFMGYCAGDDGKPKVEVIKRQLLAFNPTMEIETFQSIFPSAEANNALKACDILIATPDHHWWRIKAAEFASLHTKPLFSGGAGIYVHESGEPYRISCSTWLQLPAPLGPCLKCLGVKAKFPPQYEQIIQNVRRSYVKGFKDTAATPASVVTLHNQCANLLVRHILFYLADINDAKLPLHLVYDEIPLKFEDLTSLFERHEDCPICGANSYWGYGDSKPKFPSREEIEKMEMSLINSEVE